MKLHFVGLGGIGISGLAQLCYSRGDEITGSNQGSTPMLQKLIELNIGLIYEQHAADNLSTNTDLLIYSEAVPESNPERLKAEELNIPQVSYFEHLGTVAKDYQLIAVAGTHGKTTTTGLIATAFKAAEFEATVLVGSTLPALEGNNFYAGTNNYLIVEACEYRDNFKFLKPDILLLTNTEWDHADYFKTEESYYKAFKSLAARSKNILFHQNDETTRAVLEDVNANLIPVPQQSANSWEALLQIFGDANQQNATLALALGHVLELDLNTYKEGLGQYKGAGRRQEYLGEHHGLKVFDDYGHHPTAITATLEAFRAQFPASKIGLIYEPHQYSRTHQFFAEFAQAFTHADHCALFPIYEARDTAQDKAAVSLKDFVADNSELQLVSNLKEAQTFAAQLNKSDLLVFMGAGKISAFAKEFMNT